VVLIPVSQIPEALGLAEQGPNTTLLQQTIGYQKLLWKFYGFLWRTIIKKDKDEAATAKGFHPFF
jgi:hypothetical protein